MKPAHQRTKDSKGRPNGYGYRLDVDPRVAPLDLFNSAYLNEHGGLQNLSKDYPGTKSAPLFSWPRPRGCLHKPQFFSACVNDLDLPGFCGAPRLRNHEVFYGKRKQANAGVSA